MRDRRYQFLKSAPPDQGLIGSGSGRARPASIPSSLNADAANEGMAETGDRQMRNLSNPLPQTGRKLVAGAKFALANLVASAMSLEDVGNVVERAKGIEPSYAAWEAAVLPLNYARGGATIGWRGRGDKRAPARLS
jgi:hypothetical protein